MNELKANSKQMKFRLVLEADFKVQENSRKNYWEFMDSEWMEKR